VTVVGDGNQSDGSTESAVEVDVPLDVCGNQVTVNGDDNQPGGPDNPAPQDPTPEEPPGTPASPGDPGSPGGGAGGGNGDGGDDGNRGVVGPAFGGGPGHPGAVAAGAGFPPAASPGVRVLPQTGTSVSLTTLVGGLLLLLGGLTLLRPSRSKAKGGATRTT
jgi:LPXTG-motif cell wall-anchored protein